MMAHEPNAGKVVNGWSSPGLPGSLDTNYLQRALLNWQGPGWNRLEDSVYPLTKVDGEGKTLSGAKRYVVHFAKGELPPVQGFWSLTLYDTDGFFVPNPLDRVNLSQQSPFNFNEDGSLDLYIQNDSPGKDKEANWLPCPKGDFALFMRLYWPNEKAPSILDGLGAASRYETCDEVLGNHRLQERMLWLTNILRERAAGIAQHQSDQINRLTLVSVIFLPITFVTGFFGMNFNWMIANIGDRRAFLALGVALPVIIVGLTVVLFRRRGLLPRGRSGQRLL